MIRGSRFATAASAIALVFAAMPAQAKPEAPQENPILTDFNEQQAEVDRLGSEWAVANAAATAAAGRAERIDKQIERHVRLSKQINPNYQQEQDEYVGRLRERFRAEKAEADKLKTVADSKRNWFVDARDALEQQSALGPPRKRESYTSESSRPEAGACSIDTASERLNLNPNDCSLFAQGATQYGVGGRVLDRRGVTIQLSASGSSTEVTLQLADKVNYRRIRTSIVDGKEVLESQRPWQLGYKIGIKSANSGRLFGISERDSNRRVGDLDRLDEKVTLLGGLSFGIFPREPASKFEGRATAMHKAAKTACLAEQSSGAEHPSTCEGEALLEWIFESKGGNYAHAEHVEAFNKVYWGSAQAVPSYGAGYQLELGLPQYSYFPFSLVEVPNPFGGGQPSRVADVNNLPARFLDGDPIRERHLTWAQTVYAFWHRPGDEKGWNLGTTVILSGTHKRSYEFPSGTKDVTVCPTNSPAAPAFTTQLCQTVNIADVTRVQDIIGGIELRQQVRGIPAIPQFGILPKFTHEFDRGRNAIDVPIYFTLDDKGKLNGGIRFAHEWGGVTAAGADRKSKSELSIFFGTTFNLSPNQ